MEQQAKQMEALGQPQEVCGNKSRKRMSVGVPKIAAPRSRLRFKAR
jgi:hypothetical protein